MKSKGQLNRKSYLAFGVAILVLLGLGVTSYRDVVESGESNRWLRHTHEVLENLQSLSSTMNRIESNDRGYVLTGRESYVESWRADKLIAEQNVATLGSLTQDNRLQQSRMVDMERLVVAKFQFGETVINLRRAHGFDAAADAIRAGEGQQLMDEFQTLVRNMEDEERSLLGQRITDTKRHMRQTKILLFLGTLLGVVITLGAGRTARREAAARDLSEGRYCGLLEAAPDAMVVVNRSGEIVLVNVQAEKQFGYRRDELLGQKVKNIIPEGFAERLIADATRNAADALVQQIGMGIELSGRRKDGSQFPIEIMLSPLESAEGILVTAAIRNISARKTAEEHLARMENRGRDIEAALRECDGRYRMLLDGIKDYAIFMMDPKGNIVSWNAGAERIKGYKAEQIVGHNFSCFFPPEDIEEGRPEEVLRLTAVNGRHEEQSMRVRKDGSQFLASLTLTAFHDRAGNLLGFSEFSHDLSESKESGAKYRGLLEAAPDAMVVVNRGGEIVLLNVQAEKQFGYSRDELVGQKVKNIIPKGFAERLIADATRSTAEALAQQIGMGIELSGRRKDGSEFPIEIMLSPLESAEGILITAAIRDISVRKAAEEHLVQMESRYRGLLEAAPDAMVVVNQGGKILLVNVQAEKQFSYRRDELVGQWVKSIIPKGFAERLIADATRSTAEALAQQIGMGIELSGRRKDGSEFPIEIMLSPLESAEGILVTAAIRDISVRKAAEEHLVQMESRYRGLLEAAPDAMVVVNQDGEIVLLNVQAEKQFGYRRDELLGQKVKNIIPEGFAERLIADGTRSAAEALAQQIGTGIELSGRRKDGIEFPIEIMLSPLESAEGVLVTAAIRNISARKKSEEDNAELERRVAERTKELGVANQVLEQSNVELKQFAYVASHDLQSPLRSISGFVQLLRLEYESKLDEQAQDWIGRTVQSIEQMQTLIRDLLSYSRVDARSRPFMQIPFLDVVNDAVAQLDSSIHDSGAQVTWDPLPQIMGDRSQLVQLMQNLIGNGLNYRSDQPPRIHISAEHSGKEWIFCVRDNGIGIDPKYHEQIFEMFRRLHDQKEHPGTGIGLAVCRRVVNRHGGKIWVESEPGHGSTFRFTIPEGTEQTHA
jgi:PAS domain S-box-containing protein